MTDKSKPEELTDADLDDVQGGAAKHYVKQSVGKGAESEGYINVEWDVKGEGIVLSSEGENPNVKR